MGQPNLTYNMYGGTGPGDTLLFSQQNLKMRFSLLSLVGSATALIVSQQPVVPITPVRSRTSGPVCKDGYRAKSLAERRKLKLETGAHMPAHGGILGEASSSPSAACAQAPTGSRAPRPRNGTLMATSSSRPAVAPHTKDSTRRGWFLSS